MSIHQVVGASAKSTSCSDNVRRSHAICILRVKFCEGSVIMTQRSLNHHGVLVHDLLGLAQRLPNFELHLAHLTSGTAVGTTSVQVTPIGTFADQLFRSPSPVSQSMYSDVIISFFRSEYSPSVVRSLGRFVWLVYCLTACLLD